MASEIPTNFAFRIYILLLEPFFGARHRKEKLDMILTARLGGPQYSGPPCELETTAVRAPLEAVVEEADVTWPSGFGTCKATPRRWDHGFHY